jgi:hypothetical protein
LSAATAAAATPAAPTAAATPAAPTARSVRFVDSEAELFDEDTKRARVSPSILTYADADAALDIAARREYVLPAHLDRTALAHGTYDEKLLVQSILDIAQAPCLHCAARTLIFQGDKRLGMGGSLMFICGECGAGREVPRCNTLPAASGKGRPIQEGTLRFVHSMHMTGVNFTNANHYLLAMDQPALNYTAWEAAMKRVTGSTEDQADGQFKKNIEEEIRLTLRYEGESARAPDGSVYITVLTDGSWQKRYGRNSLAGIGAVYGRYTNKCLHAGSRIARCAVCASAVAMGKAMVREHVCTKNWDERQGADGAASLMEKSIALESVIAILENNAIVRVRLLDGARALA